MHTVSSLPFLALLLLISMCTLSVLSEGTRTGKLHTYIIHVHRPDALAAELLDYSAREEWHKSFLPSSALDGFGERRFLYSYNHVLSGFAARLTEEELMSIQEKDGFAHAQLDEVLTLHTTYSPSFLGLHRHSNGLWETSGYGKGMIIGMLDTGVWPNHPSFNDKGMPPPPPKWKGKCEFNSSAHCNKKIIGARVFEQGWRAAQGGQGGSFPPPTPLDETGHGTHTASIAAGSFVEGASVMGSANGTAAGIAPAAHLAIYKVCKLEGCYNSDLLAGIDTAVDDGVDVISISIGGSPRPLYNETIDIAAFGAMRKGVFVSCSAGNSGPSGGSVDNAAPWILTVGASTMNRSVRATVRLGSGEEFDGESLYQPTNFSSKPLPLVYPRFVNASFLAGYCLEGSLDGIDVKGKVVVCDVGINNDVEKGVVVKKAGGAAMIVDVANSAQKLETYASAHVLPASYVNSGGNISAYINSVSGPRASILFKGTVFDGAAPAVASFSSRGPSLSSPGILKPDIIGPGVNVLAAWPTGSPPFHVLSGTSMSTPHLSGVAALIKSTHPDWSPAMIKSAIMTTADITDSAGSPITDNGAYNYQSAQAGIYATGAGHVNPSRANNPGLVYDIGADDYIAYLCGLLLTDKQVGVIAHRPVKCSEVKKIEASQLNYPSIAVELGTYSSLFAKVKRTATNVGPPNTTYTVKVVPPPGATVVVQPKRMSFGEVGEKRQYTVHFSHNSTELGGGFFFPTGADGYLMWVSSDQRFSVRSPMLVTFK